MASIVKNDNDGHLRVLDVNSAKEVGKRLAVQRVAKRKEQTEDILKLRDLPEEMFTVTDVREIVGKWGTSKILTLERIGKKLKVWSRDRMKRKLGTILRRRLDNCRMNRAKKGGHYYYDFEAGC